VEIFICTLIRSQGEDSSVSNTDSIRCHNQINIAGFLDCLEFMGGFATGATTDGVALNLVLTVESELFISNDEFIIVLDHVAEDDLASLSDVNEVP
jgi:hypothetical protein